MDKVKLQRRNDNQAHLRLAFNTLSDEEFDAAALQSEDASNYLKQRRAQLIERAMDDCVGCPHPPHVGYCMVRMQPPEVGQGRCACFSGHR